jgi:hypothetical protein
MKLSEISTLETRRFKETQVFMRIIKNGTIWFTCGAVDKLFLTEGTMISIFQDIDKPKEFYIRHGGNILVHARGKSCFAGSIASVKKIMKELNLDEGRNYSFMIASKPTEHNGEMFHAILTSKTY